MPWKVHFSSPHSSPGFSSPRLTHHRAQQKNSERPESLHKNPLKFISRKNFLQLSKTKEKSLFPVSTDFSFVAMFVFPSAREACMLFANDSRTGPSNSSRRMMKNCRARRKICNRHVSLFFRFLCARVKRFLAENICVARSRELVTLAQHGRSICRSQADLYLHLRNTKSNSSLSTVLQR